MPSIQVLFNGAVKETVGISNDETSIGRKESNNIRINNPGVSGCHAKILLEGENYFIVDGYSTNGTYVNGEQVSRKLLKYGDTITIFKHSLKFNALSAHQHKGNLTVQEIISAPQNGTVAVDTTYIHDLLKKQSQIKSAYLLVSKKGDQQRKQLITSSEFKIGKGAECNVRMKGWLIPNIAASIMRKANGYYLAPAKRGKVCINGMKVIAETRLKDGDNLDIGKVSSIFYLAPSEIQSINQ